MDAQLTKKLEKLRADYLGVVGKPFSHFFCPVLFRDEAVPLCKAHIVNAAFSASSRRWTIQRTDVDNFYGSLFEADFVDLQRRPTAEEAFIDPHLYRRLRPKVFLEGSEVEHFIADGPIPNQYTRIVIEELDRRLQLGLKLTPQEVLAKANADWQIAVEKDLRLAAIVSVLKAAHLTLFEMLGYGYALGLAGRYTGQILGSFFVENEGRAKSQVLANAASYFAHFATMVRPVEFGPPELTGSIDDCTFYVCWTEADQNPRPWGGIVFVRTHRMLHAALIPIFDSLVGAVRFKRFLQSSESTLEVSVARLEKDHWITSKESRTLMKWPRASLT